MIKQFIYNEEMHQWERIDNIQEYKGVIIKTITYHLDHLFSKVDNHREYEVIYPNGKTSRFPINKRGGNIKDLKYLIDLKAAQK